MRLTVEPVCRLVDRSILGYEVRWRVPRLDAAPSIPEIWEAAEAADLLNALDDTLLHAELEVAKRLVPGAVLVQVHPWRWRRPGLVGSLAREARAMGLNPGNLVWQLVDRPEEQSRLDATPLAELSGQLHERGFKVALAQLGATRTRLAGLAVAEPDLLQLDSVLVDGIATSRGQRAVVSAMVAFAAEMDCYLAAGGIAEERQREVLRDVGVAFGHGPLMGDPLEAAGVLGLPGARSLLVLTSPSQSAPLRAEAPRRHRRELAPPRRDGSQMGIAEILSQAARAFQTEHDPHATLELAADYLDRVVPSDGLSIYEADWDTGRFRPVLARSAKDPTYASGVMAYPFGLGTGLTGWAFDLGVPQRVNDADAHPAAGHVPGTTSEDESMLLIPLIAGDFRLGMLNMVRFRRDAYLADDLNVAALVAHMAAAAWRNAQLYSEQVQHAITDSLTGLLNTRWLRDAGRREVAIAERQDEEMAVLMVDLDNFKEVNDNFGHAAGDAILRDVGRALQRSVRAEDAAVRYGGEEFVLILRGCGRTGARRIASEIRHGLARIRLPEGAEAGASVTASIGVALFPKHGRTMGQLLGVADAAMYAAKRRGKDRVSLAR